MSATNLSWHDRPTAKRAASASGVRQGDVTVTCSQRTAGVATKRHGSDIGGHPPLARDRGGAENGMQRVDTFLLIGGNAHPAIMLHPYQQLDASGAL
jgi:hypothetical protein